jgi:hypothetical protein
VAASSPLQTLLLLLGGASPEAPLAAAAAAAVDGAGAVPSLPSAPGAAASGSQVPAVFRPAAVSGVPAPAWRQHLAMLAANRTPGDAAALLLLAGRLLAAGQVLPAHLAFILAGSFPQPWDLAVAAATAPAPAGSAPGQASSPSRTPAPALLAAAAQPGGSPGSNPGSAAAPAAATPPLVLLGADVAGRPRSLAQLPHVLATEVYAWARTAGECLRASLCFASHSGRDVAALSRPPSCGTAAPSCPRPPLQPPPCLLASPPLSSAWRPSPCSTPSPWPNWGCCPAPQPTARP